MSDNLHLQVYLAASPADVYVALTDNGQLQQWFAEHADVSVAEGKYHFWGRYTPEDLSHAEGQHPLIEAVPNEKLVFAWTVRKFATRVMIALRSDGDGTRLILKQKAAVEGAEFNPWAAEDFWYFSLGNLKRYLDGRSVTRCDYRSFVKGDVTWSLDIDASVEAVFGALIRPDQLNKWIASDSSVTPVVGGSWSLGWNEVPASKILELVPNKKLTFEWASWGDNPATVVTWTVAKTGGKTRLTLFHSGFAPDQDAPEQEGWLNYMMQLRSVLEYGDAWAPVVKELPADLASFYARAINERQAWLML